VKNSRPTSEASTGLWDGSRAGLCSLCRGGLEEGSILIAVLQNRTQKEEHIKSFKEKEFLKHITVTSLAVFRAYSEPILWNTTFMLFLSVCALSHKRALFCHYIYFYSILAL
jgi:hypothetical protein